MSKLNIFLSIENQSIDIQCPICNIHKRVLFKDVLLNRKVICPGCEGVIKLVDRDASGRKTRLEIQEFEKEISNIFKKL